MKHKGRFLLIGCLLVLILLSGGIWAGIREASAAGGTYVVLGWNDLGMHCYNKDFRDMAVLPPYNTLWVQVVKKGNPPTLVTDGIVVSYSFQNNTYSAGKTNFWKYVQPLFGVSLAPNIGLTGNGLKGNMKLATDHFVADGIPLTEYTDTALTTRQPYQLAKIVVKDAATGVVLGRQTVVAPVSSEMRCNNCHADGGSANPRIRTGRVGSNILTLHDRREGTQLMSQRPVLCADCHASNALGMSGVPGVLNLSNAMHLKHSGVVPNTINGCYNCHPGPTTRCLRDVMAQSASQMWCTDCHGHLADMGNQLRVPWQDEPRCGNCSRELDRQWRVCPHCGSPATPAPMTNTLAGRTVPAAVMSMGKYFGSASAARITALYPAMDAMEERESMACAREIRGIASVENEVTLLDDAGAHRLPRMGKVELARRLVAEIADRLPTRR